MCLIAIGGRVKPASVLVLVLAWPAGTHPPGPSSPTLYLGSCELPWRGPLWRQTQMTSFLWELRVCQCFSSDMECPGALGLALGTFMWGQHTPEPCPHPHSRPLCVCETWFCHSPFLLFEPALVLVTNVGGRRGFGWWVLGEWFPVPSVWDNCLGPTGHLLSVGGWMEARCWEVCASVSQQR